jgi:hypothetical protein
MSLIIYNVFYIFSNYFATVVWSLVMHVRKFEKEVMTESTRVSILP